MHNGPEQEARDEIFKSQLGKDISVKFPSRWSVTSSFSLFSCRSIAYLSHRTCPEVQPWLYGYNAYAEAEKALRLYPYKDVEKEGT